MSPGIVHQKSQLQFQKPSSLAKEHGCNRFKKIERPSAVCFSRRQVNPDTKTKDAALVRTSAILGGSGS